MNEYVWIPILLLIALLLFAFYKRYKMIKSMGNEPESNKLVVLTDASFVKQLSEGVCLVDFWAPWCMPCKMLGPVISQLADEIGDQAKICKLNVDDHKKMATKYGVKGIPTVILFKDGKPVKRFVGVKPKSAYMKAIKEIL